MFTMNSLIDPLIAERAPWLYRRSIVGRMCKPILEAVLGYKQTVKIAKELSPLCASDIMDALAERLAKCVHVNGLNHVPRSGAALIVATHPTGIADGIILHHVLRQIRQDTYYFANRDILRVLPQMSEVIVPVEWRKEKRSHAKTRQTMMDTQRAVRMGRLGVIFPSGRLAKRRGLQLYERQWMASAAMIARKFDLPVIPIHLSARNSFLFYAFDAIHPTLRDITLFHETLNKSKYRFDVTIGSPVPALDLPERAHSGIDMLFERTLELAEHPKIDQMKPIYKTSYKSLVFTN